MFTNKSKWFVAFVVVFLFKSLNAQIVNYVSNGSFEELNPGAQGYTWDGAKYWGPLDSSKISYYLCTTSSSNPNVPYVSTGFQHPRTGNSFAGTQFYCGGSTCNSNNSREYLRNRLKTVLQPNKTYCAKYFVVNTNNNVVAIDAFGAYFGDSDMDTIKYCMNAITYLNPQLNYTGPIITDTLNWTAITGTFVATGIEKYMVLGNFKSNALTNTLQVNPSSLLMTADIYIDDVSLIDIDLPAYAYSSNAAYAIPGSTLYLGRQKDVGIDEACMWYQLPNITTAIDTTAGITITVAVTTETYMVKQDICGVIKYDTIVVYPSAVGLVSSGGGGNDLLIFPNPASSYITVRAVPESELSYVIKDIAGKEVLSGDLYFKDNEANLNVDLNNGVYLITITGSNGSTTKKVVINK